MFDPGRTIYERGAPADTVLFLLTGTVRIDAADSAPVTSAAPAAINLADALVGRPMTATVTAVDEAIGLSLSASVLLTLLSDDSAAAQALFRMLLGSRAALERAYVAHWTDEGRGATVEPGSEAIAMGLHVRRILPERDSQPGDRAGGCHTRRQSHGRLRLVGRQS